jgi:hypothetical protein
MLPAAKTHRFSLADVLPNCLDAVLGRRGRLGLAPVTHAVVLLADGLGLEALTVRRGHARTLASRLELDAPIGAGFPTTTAAAIATLTTGELPGRHGLVGYTVLDPEHDRVVNQLTGWDERLDPASWQRMPTIFERAAQTGVASYAIGHSRFRDSGFTAAVLRGAEYLGADVLETRVDRAIELLNRPGPTLSYLYVSDLDVIAHTHGVESGEWTRALESLDAVVARLVRALSPRQGLVVTADHGIIDVAAGAQIIVAPELLVGVRHVAGEPRCLQLHLESEVDAEEVAERWREREGPRAWVGTREQVIEAGWFGPVDAGVLDRIGQVFVAARRPVAYYVDPQDRGRGMVGQHGSLTPAETAIPLLRFGAWAN